MVGRSRKFGETPTLIKCESCKRFPILWNALKHQTLHFALFQKNHVVKVVLETIDIKS